MPAIANLVAFIRRRQQELGLGQNELARSCGLRQGTLANLLAGRVVRAPSLNTLGRLAVGLQVPIDELLNLIELAPAGQMIQTGKRATAPAQACGATNPAAGSDAFPLNDSEREILRRAAQAGVEWTCAADPAVMALPPDARRSLFKMLDCFVYSVQLHKRLAGATIAPAEFRAAGERNKTEPSSVT